ncbi:hypothetical protein CW731_11765 [Polaribacter sp. ALD11]|uniref:hypothetical protein n=1 Tax=Polaribacter sp. ALD11 TaxID=2058137 RepID=UPI000C311BFC|nr:hypothetical protein [Polaribacter sp. ALD11]AUC85925.1 hypothetical protein CW731_11765 [Polaribacter sp. ALD11]
MALATYTKEELLKKLKSQKTMFAIKGVVILLMIVFAIFSTIENGLSFHTFLPLFFIPMSVYMFNEMKKIEKELALRK